MMTDLYQLTMMYGYYRYGMAENEGIFDLFYRQNRKTARLPLWPEPNP